MKNIFRTALFPALLLVFALPVHAQKNNIRVSKIPEDVIQTLTRYMEILNTSETVEQAANTLFKEGIIGGGLLNYDGSAADSDLLRYGLKKDFQNVKFYQFPPKITGITYVPNDYDGYQQTLIKGNTYKMWLKKKSGVAGPPAPVPVLKPNEGAPRVITSIGSL